MSEFLVFHFRLEYSLLRLDYCTKWNDDTKAKSIKKEFFILVLFLDIPARQNTLLKDSTGKNVLKRKIH